MEKVAAALRQGRIALGMKQTELAHRLGITPAFLNDIEHGRKTLGDKYVEHLPDGIRGPVVQAMRAALAAQDEKLKRLA